VSIANELIVRGWCQNYAMDAEGRVCLYGAAALAAGLDVRPKQQLVGLLVCNRAPEYARALAQAVDGSEAMRWNDADGRTFDEVLRLAKEADEILGAG
jgi:hypothetical protein